VDEKVPANFLASGTYRIVKTGKGVKRGGQVQTIEALVTGCGTEVLADGVDGK
jgi:hypothetical protein